MTIKVAKDLRARFGMTRDQGLRPTCLAFAASDAHSVIRGMYAELSAEHIYYHGVARTPGGSANSGISLQAVLRALEFDGQCGENGWPYLTSIPSDSRKWTPPPTATPLFRCVGQQCAATVDEIVAQLDQGNPVIMTLLLSESFYVPRDGVVPFDARDVDTDNHAVIAIGYGFKNRQRHILIRNSWGAGWAENGYAWIPEPYLASRLHHAAELETAL